MCVLYVRECSQVLEVLLDAPQCVGALLQLGYLGVCQGHVDHAADATAVQDARQRQEDLLTDAVHVLKTHSKKMKMVMSGEKDDEIFLGSGLC